MYFTGGKIVFSGGLYVCITFTVHATLCSLQNRNGEISFSACVSHDLLVYDFINKMVFLEGGSFMRSE